MGRYTGSPDALVLDQRVELRGFSAGILLDCAHCNYCGRSPMLVMKGKLGAIACPPQLLVTLPATHALHLFHYESDQLCVWKPGHRQLDQLQICCTYVSTEGPAYKRVLWSKGAQLFTLAFARSPAGWCPMLRAPRRGMPRPCNYSCGSVFAWNLLWRRSLKKPCFIFPPPRR